jgi:Cdc6-like AAA superfamily ATPase
VKSRLGDAKILSNKSIEFVAKKVAAYSGDVRRGLQIAKRAVELGRQEY